VVATGADGRIKRGRRPAAVAATLRECGLDLPRPLAVLLDALTAEPRHAPPSQRTADGLVPFKSAGHLVSVLSASLDRLVTRRALLRYISALRRSLRRAPRGQALTIQTNRWLGWRAVPEVPAAGAQSSMALRRRRQRPSNRCPSAVRRGSP
jgi:hypothetical protein